MNAIDRIMVLMAKEIVKAECPEVLMMDDARLLAAIKERFTLVFQGDAFALVPVKG